MGREILVVVARLLVARPGSLRYLPAAAAVAVHHGPLVVDGPCGSVVDDGGRSVGAAPSPPAEEEGGSGNRSDQDEGANNS